MDGAPTTFTGMEWPALTIDDLPRLIGLFHERLVAEPLMGPYVAGLDLRTHVPHIARLGAMALFRAPGCQGVVMTIHMQLITWPSRGDAPFQPWLAHFDAALEAVHSGSKVEEAKQRARTIAAVMQHRFTNR